MALGIPVIITDYSGCKDYANDETAYLLRPEGFVRESTMDNIPQFSGKEWAYVSVSQLKKTMRKVLLSPEESRAKAEFARGYVCNKFSQKEIAKMFVEGIENLL
jgi:glycosyltransferase involved in cell wall biosynthesis